MNGGRAPVTLAVAIAVALAARPATAFVRAVNQMGIPVYWPTSCAQVTIYPNGFSMLSADQVAKSVAGAAAAWSAASVTCPGTTGGDGGEGHPYFEVVPAFSSGGTAPGIAYDGHNTIVFETVDWPENPEALALTVRHTSPDGQILDADMEINATATFCWTNLDPGAEPACHGMDAFDLQTALTHEFGHFLGLAHTCTGGTGSDGDDPGAVAVDDQGRPIPVCSDPPDAANVEAAKAVMWYEVAPSSAAKRVLSADDVAAVCALYPPSRDPHRCSLDLPDDGCGCATGGRPAGPGIALALAALAGAVARRRLRSGRARRATR